MIRLSLIGVRVEVPTNQPIVLLREEGGTRFLPIFIGSPEIRKMSFTGDFPLRRSIPKAAKPP